MTALSVTIGRAAIFMAASIMRNRMTRPESVRPVQIDQREADGMGSFNTARLDMMKLRSQIAAVRPFRCLAHRGHRRLDIHPHRLEDMAVEVFEAAAVHEAVILLGPWVGLAAGATAFSTIASTSWRLSIDRQRRASTSLFASTIRFEVNSAKCAWLRIMKKIVSDHTIAPARPGWLKRSSLVKPMAS